MASPRTHDAIITSSWGQNDVVLTSLWRYHYVMYPLGWRWRWYRKGIAWEVFDQPLCKFNSSPPSAAYMRQWTGSTLIQLGGQNSARDYMFWEHVTPLKKGATFGLAPRVFYILHRWTKFTKVWDYDAFIQINYEKHIPYGYFGGLYQLRVFGND